MNEAPFWRVLGIPPSDDEAVIRTAYARRLKLTQPEDNAEGFKALRAAYEAALRAARWRIQASAQQHVVDEDEFDFDLEPFADDAFELGGARANLVFEQSNSTAKPLNSLKQAHRDACTKLETALKAGETRDAVMVAYEAIVQSPAMNQLDVHVATETWLIYLLQRLRPASDLLVDRAIADFGWTPTPARFHSDRGGSFVVHMRETIALEQASREFLLRVQDPQHEFRAAYKEMTRPFTATHPIQRLCGLRHFGLVRRFLDYVDDRFPAANEQLDFDTVLWWRKRIAVLASPIRILSLVVRIALVFGVIAALAIFMPPAPSLPAPSTNQAPSIEATQPILLREQCWRAVRLDGPNAEEATACRRAFAATPDSLLMAQFAGIEDLKSSNLNEALQHFTDILAISPADPVALYGQGLALSSAGNVDQRSQGYLLMMQAMRLDPGVDDYFVAFGFPLSNMAPADTPPQGFVPRASPPFDVRPRHIVAPPQSVFDEAYRHFGIGYSFDAGEVKLECLTRSDGHLSDCSIIEETPRNQGLGELAIRIITATTIEPAKKDGAPIDGVPIRVPVTFRRSP